MALHRYHPQAMEQEVFVRIKTRYRIPDYYTYCDAHYEPTRDEWVFTFRGRPHDKQWAVKITAEMLRQMIDEYPSTPVEPTAVYYPPLTRVRVRSEAAKVVPRVAG